MYLSDKNGTEIPELKITVIFSFKRLKVRWFQLCFRNILMSLLRSQKKIFLSISMFSLSEEKKKVYKRRNKSISGQPP